MSWRSLSSAGLCLGTMMMFAGSAVLAQAAASTSKASNESNSSARLLRDVHSDAVHVQTAAAKLDQLAQNPNATWIDYDRQWNIMKPCVEDMVIRIARLEKMEANVSAAEKTEIDQAKTGVQAIQARVHALRKLL